MGGPVPDHRASRSLRELIDTLKQGDSLVYVPLLLHSISSTMSTDVHLLVLSTLLGLAVQSAAQLNARYRLQPGQVGSLCSGLTPDQCRKDVPYVLTRSVVECAVHCTKHPGCKSFSFQIRPNSARHTHRCEMAPDKVHTIQSAAKNGSGYEYYRNVS